MKISNLCIIAGSGNLPRYAVSEAVRRKINFRVYIIDEEDDSFSRELKSQRIDFRKISLGKFDEVLKNLKIDRISHTLIVGKVRKKNMLSTVRFNVKTLLMLKKIRNWNDKSIFELIAAEFKKINVEILKQDIFLKSLLCGPGIYSRKKPAKNELADMEYGMNFAKKIAALDIGQTVIVSNRTLVAVEAIEGTDEAIKRAGLYVRNHTAVVCKAMRKNQDTRFDVPTVGLDTLEAMHQNGCRVLAIQAKKTFVADQENFFKKIDKYKMVFVSI